MTISIEQALRASKSSSIAFIGAGGKTTALFQLARELVKHTPVIVTATAHLGAWQVSLADQHLIVESPEALDGLENKLQGVTLITGKFDGDRTKPLDAESLNWLNQFCKKHAMPLLIEADGSRQKPLKGWAEHEPPIPDFVEQVVTVAGLAGLGKILNAENVHRAEIFSKLSGLEVGKIITPDALARVLTHPNGGQKNIPSDARKIVLLNQADTVELQAMAHGMIDSLLPGFDSVAIASLKQENIFAVHESVAGVILAAGESVRFGKPKQLLDWKGEAFVHAVARTALEAGLSPVVVVVGANGKEVEAAVADLNVVIVKNDEWKSGQGSSIKAGILFLTQPPPSLPQIRQENSGLKTNVSNVVFGGGACIFLLADQPQITTSIIRALIEKHAEGLYPIIAPMVLDQRANPVLFDRVTFADLLEIQGDVGGRTIFHKHRVEYIPWHDDRMLLDVDTPEMYQRLITDETL